MLTITNLINVNFSYVIMSMLLIPVGACGFFLLCRYGKIADKISSLANIVFCVLSFMLSVLLGIHFYQHGAFSLCHEQFYLDALNVCYLCLTTFILTTVAIFSYRYMLDNVKDGKITAKTLNLYHILYQFFGLSMITVLLANNLGILWVAMEGATLATALLVGLYRTAESVEASWKYFILCIVGIALALFGTIFVYFSAQHIIEHGSSQGMLWTFLREHATLLNPKILTLASVFIFVGYATKIGLFPLHYWLPDAHSESPASISALLSGLLLNLGLYAILRFKMIIIPATQSNLLNDLLMAFGLLSFVVASFFMLRQRNIKRLFSYSSIENLGLIAFAFGLNNGMAIYAGLLYSFIHSLIKSALFMNVGVIINVYHTQNLDKMRNLIHNQPWLGWSFFIGVLALCGMPPFALFNSKLLLIVATFSQHIWLAFGIIAILIVAIASLLHNIQPLVYGKNKGYCESVLNFSNVFPFSIHLGIALILGFAMPLWLQNILYQATQLLG